MNDQILASLRHEVIDLIGGEALQRLEKAGWKVVPEYLWSRYLEMERILKSCDDIEGGQNVRDKT